MPAVPLTVPWEPPGVLLPGVVTDTVAALLGVLPDTVNVAVATAPSASRFRLAPTRRQVYRPLAVLLQYRLFAAESAEDPTDTLTALKSVVE